MELVAFVVLGVVVIGGLYLMYQQMLGRPRSRDARFAAVEPTPVSGIREPGVHRLAGTARPLGEVLDSPVSGRPHLALDVLVQAHQDGTTRRTHRSAVDFLLDDGTGVVLVHASEVEVAVEHDFESEPTPLDQVPFADEVLRRGGVRIGSPTTCRVRMWEGVIQPGERVGVLGQVEPADAAARSAGATWVVRSAEGTRLLVRREPDTDSD